jgi:hypothetical protein
LGNEEPEKWEAWKPKWESTLSDQDKKLLAFANKLRLDVAKRGGADPVMVLEEVELHELVNANLDVDPWPIAAYPHHRRTLPGVPPSIAFRPAYYFEQEGGKEEVTALCARYLEFLEKMLTDFCADNQP